MSTQFLTVSNGQTIEAEDINRYIQPIQDLESGAALYRVATNTGNDYKVSFAGPENPVSAYTNGLVVHLKAAASNSGSATLTITGPSGDLAPVNLVKKGGMPLASGDISTGQMLVAIYTEDSGGANKRFEVVGAASAGGGGGGGATSLDDLNDVTVSGASSGQVLRHNGTVFINSNLAATDMPSGIDAANLGTGSVSNTELSYLDGVTGSIQSQLNGKAASSHTHAISSVTNLQTTLDAKVSGSCDAGYLPKMSASRTIAKSYGSSTKVTNVRNVAGGQVVYWNSGTDELTYQFSRRSHKENIRRIETSIDDLMQWKPVEFEWKENFGGISDIGLIAEEVASVYPLAATYDQPWDYVNEKTGEYTFNEDGSPKKLEGFLIPAGVKYEKAWIPMMAAVQDFYQRYQASEARAEALEARVRALEDV